MESASTIQILNSTFLSIQIREHFSVKPGLFNIITVFKQIFQRRQSPCQARNKLKRLKFDNIKI